MKANFSFASLVFLTARSTNNNASLRAVTGKMSGARRGGEQNYSSIVI